MGKNHDIKLEYYSITFSNTMYLFISHNQAKWTHFIIPLPKDLILKQTL